MSQDSSHKSQLLTARPVQSIILDFIIEYNTSIIQMNARGVLNIPEMFSPSAGAHVLVPVRVALCG